MELDFDFIEIGEKTDDCFPKLGAKERSTDLPDLIEDFEMDKHDLSSTFEFDDCILSNYISNDSLKFKQHYFV